MRRKIGGLCMIVGAVLVAMALSLFLYNRWDADRAARASEEVLEQLTDVLSKAADGKDPGAAPVYREANREMTVVNIDGYDYIGYLQVPSLELTLPVMSQWSEEGLKIAPGRYSGSIYADDMVIAGHNYMRHFAPLKWVPIGTEIDFIDMDNQIWQYQVISIETLQPVQVSEMTTKTDQDAWDLTLFTCTTSGTARCALRCERV